MNIRSLGVCELGIQWPVGPIDYEGRRTGDTIALSCGDYPYVLPVFGEVYSALVWGFDPRTEKRIEVSGQNLAKD